MLPAQAINAQRSDMNTEEQDQTRLCRAEALKWAPKAAPRETPPGSRSAWSAKGAWSFGMGFRLRGSDSQKVQIPNSLYTHQNTSLQSLNTIICRST